MDLFRAALGDERMIATAFPQEQRDPGKRQEGESDGEFAARQYLIAKRDPEGKRAKRREKARNMNPNGFFEMEWTVQGIRWSIPRADDLKRAKTAPVPFVKVVSQGLALSDPRYISKIVYLIREPRAVAKSQENLSGRFPGDESPERDGKQVKIRSTSMFCQVNTAAAAWFVANPDVPVLVVKYDDLIEHPERECMRIGDFIGEGNWGAAVGKIDPSLRRSRVNEDDGIDYTTPDRIHRFVCSGNWPAVVDTAKAESERPVDRNKLAVLCPRLGRRVSADECSACRGDDNTRINFTKNAIKRGIDFSVEPCIREVVAGEKTIDESIVDNSWLPKGVGDTVADFLAKIGITKPDDCNCSRVRELWNKWFPF